MKTHFASVKETFISFEGMLFMGFVHTNCWEGKKKTPRHKKLPALFLARNRLFKLGVSSSIWDLSCFCSCVLIYWYMETESNIR